MYQLSLHMDHQEATGPNQRPARNAQEGSALAPSDVCGNLPFHLAILLSPPPNIPNIESPHTGPINTKPVFLRGCLILY